MSNCSAILSLLLSPGVGSAGVHRVLLAAGSVGMGVGEVLDMPVRGLMERLPVGLHEAAGVVARCGRDERLRAEALLGRVEACGGGAVACTEAGWPGSLGVLGNGAPPILFYRGSLGLLGKASAAVVGARDPSVVGARLASGCARFWAEEGVCVVSGGARGVDSLAHEAALGAGGCTVVVLPQGLLTYGAPPVIGEAVGEGRAVLVSQFVPDAPWEVHGAVTRNATISALSAVVCVVEPRKTGGSIRAARVAVGQRKPVAAWCASASVRRMMESAGAGELADGAGNLRGEYLKAMMNYE